MSAYILAAVALVWSILAVSKEESLEQAKQALAKGETKTAVIYLKNLLKANPKQAEGRWLLGEAYLRLGEAAGAVKELEKAKELGVAPERLAVPLARAYLLQGQAQKLLAEIQPQPTMAVELQAEIIALRGMAQLHLDDREAARQAFRRALELSNHPEGHLGLARLALLENQPQVAGQEAEQVLEANPDHLDAWLVLAESKRLQGDLSGAEKAFSEALARRPREVRALSGRAAVRLAQNQLEAARQDIQQAEKLAPELPLVQYLKGLLAFQGNDPAGAEEALLKVLSAVPNHLPSRLLLGVIAYRKNELAVAEEYLTAVHRKLPDHLPVVKLLAAVKLKQNRAEEAIRLLEPYREKLSQDPQFLALLGSAYLKNRQLDQGTELLTEAMRLAPEAAAIRTQLALGKMASGELEGAVEQLEQAIAQDPKLVQAEVMLVLARLQQKQYDLALAAAQKLAQNLPDHPLPSNLIAAVYLAKGEIDRAEAQWQATLQKHPEEVAAALNLAKLKFRQGQLEEAERYYQKVLDKQPGHAAALIGLAQIAEARQDYEAMVRRLEEARSRHPEVIEPAWMLAKYYLAKGEALKALEAVHGIAERHPDDPRVLQALGQAQLLAGEAANAVATSQKLVSLSPQDPASHYLLGSALAANGDEAAALKALEAALKLKPDYLPAAGERIRLLLKHQRDEEALAEAKKLQGLLPQQPVGYVWEGEIALQQNRYDHALAAYRRAHELQGASLTAQRLYQLYRRQGKAAQAAEILKDWLGKSPQDLGSWLVLALGYQADGLREQAILAYEKALALQPDHPVILNNLAWLYQEVGNPKALVLAERLLELGKDHPEMLDTVGWIYTQQGKFQAGLTVLQEAAVKAPHLPAVQLHLAEAWIKAGNPDQARKVLQRLLKEQANFPEREQAQKLLNTLGAD